LFHATLVAALSDWIEGAARQQNVQAVAFGGGCFLNAILSHGLHQRLRARGLTVLQAHQAPPNDGGLSLGQAWVAMQTLQQRGV
jgi:hydrogenase maturation protein HypF